ncbi:MAG: transcriptional regulator of arginine metabolism [Acidobacteriota bacterium]|jgi:transcriptional regulator of arginine metabolism|nr:transcriptional regulator of arginine metabolism [Acidobacteriota bacterium]
MPSSREIREGRRKALLDIVIDNRLIRSQTELQELLRERGIEATQSSISRDLREIGVRRVKGRYTLRIWKTVTDGEFKDVVGFVQQVRPSGTNLLVIMTSPGAARVVAFAIDSAGWPEVIGTVSGEDTLFVATPGEKEQKELMQRFGGYLK